MSSEDELIRRAQAGETEAFSLLAQAYERRIFSLAFHYCRDRQDAEDLSQEVWLKVYAALATFRNDATFYTWLRKITINCFLNHRRSRAKILPWPRQSTNDTDDTLGDYPIKDGGRSAVSLENNLQNQMVVEKVMQTLSAVTPQQRLIFLLKHQEGMTYEEIAKELDCSPGTVKKSVSRTIAKLREQFGVNKESESGIVCRSPDLEVGVFKCTTAD